MNIISEFWETFTLVFNRIIIFKVKDEKGHIFEEFQSQIMYTTRLQLKARSLPFPAKVDTVTVQSPRRSLTNPPIDACTHILQIKQQNKSKQAGLGCIILKIDQYDTEAMMCSLSSLLKLMTFIVLQQVLQYILWITHKSCGANLDRVITKFFWPSGTLVLSVFCCLLSKFNLHYFCSP